VPGTTIGNAKGNPPPPAIRALGPTILTINVVSCLCRYRQSTDSTSSIQTSFWLTFSAAANVPNSNADISDFILNNKTFDIADLNISVMDVGVPEMSDSECAVKFMSKYKDYCEKISVARSNIIRYRSFENLCPCVPPTLREYMGYNRVLSVINLLPQTILCYNH